MNILTHYLPFYLVLLTSCCPLASIGFFLCYYMEMYSVKFNENDLNVEYIPQFIEKEQADNYLSQLRTLPFFTPTFKLRIRNVKPKRQVLAYGDPNITYSISGTSIPAEPWTPLLLKLRNRVERQTGCAFNYVLLNLYVDGTNYITPHKDDESGLDATFPIAALSFGAERIITFSRPKTPPIHIKLKHGSLYIMEKPTNDLFTHGIARDLSIHDVRISLTFRHIIPLVSPSKKLKMQGSHENTTTNNESEPLPDSCIEEDINCSPLVTTTKELYDVSNWLSSSLQEMQSTIDSQEIESANPIHFEWDLNQKTFLQIMLERNFQIRIHIRTFKISTHGERIPSKKGVVMTPMTWYFFQGKLLHFKFKSVNDSFISNNQLLVASVSAEYCILQQMFRLNTIGFFLKPSTLKLTKDQISNLSLNYDITESIIEAKLLKVLPRFILKKSSLCTIHVSEEIAKKNLLMAMGVEVNRCINLYYECRGCEENSSSQINHGCLMEHAIFKFRSNRQLILLCINVFKIVKNLPQTCFCHYNTQFFKHFNPMLNDYVELENALETICDT